MDALLNPQTGEVLLVVAPHAGGALMMELVARLAGRGPLRLLDGGNRFDLYRCSQAIARALDGGTADLRDVLGRIQLARAFTCYQMVALLAETPARPVPTLVLDLLSTFYDESVPAGESRRLLETCLCDLQRLSVLAPVAVSAQPGPNRPELLEVLRAAAGQVCLLQPHLPPPQPRLF
jgi:hypothetical protein